MTTLDFHALSLTVDGHAVDGVGRFDVIDPSSAEVFADAPDCDEATLDAAFEAAQRAQPAWEADPDAREAALVAFADAIDAHKDVLTEILVREQGKPAAAAAIEVSVGAYMIRQAAKARFEPEFAWTDGKVRTEVHRRALGVVAGITPWNYPLLTPLLKIAGALGTGNTLVLKPSPFTPLSVLAAGELSRGILPAGVLNTVSGRDPLGAAVAAHPIARKVTFTGSVATGKAVGRSAMDDLKRITLELGGNDPAIVLADADPAEVGAQVALKAMQNAGQICATIKRIYVHESIAEEVVAAAKAAVEGLVLGSGLDPATTMGPIQNKPQFDRVLGFIEDSVAQGGTVVTGGKAVDGPGYFIEPTIITGLDDKARLVAEEQFGPVVPILTYTDLDDAVARANDSKFGLTASVWGRDVDLAAATAARIDAGTTVVNAHGPLNPAEQPFSGHKWSGLGVESGHWGLEEFVSLQARTVPVPREA